MFRYCCRDAIVEFWIKESDLPYVSDELKAIIVENGYCCGCGNRIHVDFRTCACVAERRNALIGSLKDALKMYGGDRKKLNREARELLRYPLYGTKVETLIDELSRPIAIYGGKYEVLSEHWDEIDKLRLRDQKRKYRARAASLRKERESEVEGAYSRSDIHAIWQIQGGACYFCSIALRTPSEKNPFHIDHLTPLYSGGSEWPHNLALLCSHCNQVKHTKSEAHFWRLLMKHHGDELIGLQKGKAQVNRPAKLKLSNARRKLIKIGVGKG